MFDLVDGLAGLVGNLFEANSNQNGTADVVAAVATACMTMNMRAKLVQGSISLLRFLFGT